MITESSSLARRQRSQTRRSNGLPAIRCKGLPRNRVEAQRAGIIPTALFMSGIHNPGRRGGKIRRYEVGYVLIGVAAVTGLNQNCFRTRLLAALNIAVFVTNEKRPSEIEIVIVRSLQHQPRRGLPASTDVIRAVRAIISCVDQLVAKLSQNFMLNTPIL